MDRLLRCLKNESHIPACPKLLFDAIFMTSRKLEAFAFLDFYPDKAESFNAQMEVDCGI
jgi:hypothetical protein